MKYSLSAGVFVLAVGLNVAAALADDERLRCEDIKNYSSNRSENDALKFCGVAKVTCSGETFYLDKLNPNAPHGTLDVVDAEGNPVKICSQVAKPSHPINLQLNMNLLDSVNVQSANASSSFSAHFDEIQAILRQKGLSDGYSFEACAPLIPGQGSVQDRINQCTHGDKVCDGDSPQCGEFCFCQHGIGSLGIAFRTASVPESGVCPADGRNPVNRTIASEHFKALRLRISGDMRPLRFTRAELEDLRMKPLGPGAQFACYYNCRMTSPYFAQFDGVGTYCSADVNGCTGVTFKHGEPIRPVVINEERTRTADCLIKGPLKSPVNAACPSEVDYCMNNAQFWSEAPAERVRLQGYGRCMIEGKSYDECLKSYKSQVPAN